MSLLHAVLNEEPKNVDLELLRRAFQNADKEKHCEEALNSLITLHQVIEVKH